ncbi:MAG: class I SAM-dependent methyltransferase [Propionivibrio sp.]
MTAERRPAGDHVPTIHWQEGETSHSARWRSEAGVAPPSRVQVADDSLTADTAFRHACGGTALLWRGDFQNARQLLQAIARRVDRATDKPPKRTKVGKTPLAPVDAFHRYRMQQAQRARILGMLLIPFTADHAIPLRRAPDVRAACSEAYGAVSEDYVASLRELLGLIGAHEWRRNGVEVSALAARIHPHYGVFAPVRGEYVALVAETPLPATVARNSVAFDVGTGTGVLAAVLARRDIARVIATDQDPRALACARENLQRLGLDAQVEVVGADLFPPGRAPLIVCNPPWVPARPASPLQHAVYDLDSRMLHGYLDGLAAHLEPGGEGWLILSDLAEHLGLRPRSDLSSWIENAGLGVLGRHDVLPTHPRVADRSDALHAARAAEITSLWRLGVR